MSENQPQQPPYPQIPTAGAQSQAPAYTGQPGTPPVGGQPSPYPPSGYPQVGSQGYPPAAGGYPHPGQGYPQVGAPGVGPVAQKNGGGFFAALFDMSFTTYVTTTWAKVIYILTIVFVSLTTLSTLVLLYSWLSFTSAYVDMSGLLIPVAIPVILGAFMTIVGVRVLLESMVAIVRTAQNTASIVEHNKAADEPKR